MSVSSFIYLNPGFHCGQPDIKTRSHKKYTEKSLWSDVKGTRKLDPIVVLSAYLQLHKDFNFNTAPFQNHGNISLNFSALYDYKVFEILM